MDFALAKYTKLSTESPFLLDALRAHDALLCRRIGVLLVALRVHSTLAFQLVELPAELALLGCDGLRALQTLLRVCGVIC